MPSLFSQSTYLLYYITLIIKNTQVLSKICFFSLFPLINSFFMLLYTQGEKMKNYYEILEVSKNASSEVIEKAYKALAKKYHPDVYDGNVKEAEEQFKEIGEAYEILSSKEKRAEYDEKYSMFIEGNASQNMNVAPDEGQLQKSAPPSENMNNLEEEVYEQYSSALNRAYYDAYIQDLKNRGYRIRYKQTIQERLKNLLALLITICVIALLFFILWHIKPVQNYIMELYNENILVRILLSPFIK